MQLSVIKSEVATIVCAVVFVFSLLFGDGLTPEVIGVYPSLALLAG